MLLVYLKTKNKIVSKVRIFSCRPPRPPLRSCSLDIKDGQYAETKDMLKKIISHHKKSYHIFELWVSKRSNSMTFWDASFLTFWTPISRKRDMMWYDFFSTSLVSAHCAIFISRLPLLKGGEEGGSTYISLLGTGSKDNAISGS